MKNSPLTPAEEAFLGFAKVMMALLPENSARSPLPIRSTRIRKFTTDGNWEWVVGNELDLPQLYKLFPMQSIDLESPQMQACVRTHYHGGLMPIPKMSDKEGITIENPSDRQLAGSIIYSLIWPFWHACSEDNSIDPSCHALVSAYRNYFKKSHKNLSFLPLQGIKKIPESLRKVDDHISIIPASPEWKMEYQSIFEYGRFTKANIIDLGSIQWLIQVELAKGENQNLTTECRDLLTAIRLISNGEIGVPVAIADSEAPKPRMVGARTQPTDEFTTSSWHSEVEISQNDVESILDIYATFKELRKQNKFDAIAFTLRRYNMAFCRENAEDAFVDLVIATEAILLRNNKDQLSYRFLVRGTALLAGKYPPNELMQMLKGAYEIRSGLVHGSYSGKETEPGHKELSKALRKFDSTNLNQALLKMRELAGHVLCSVVKALKNHQNIDQYLIELDNLIANRLNIIYAENA